MYSRLVLLVRNNVQYEIMKNYMEIDIFTIWVKLVKRGRKKVIVGGCYREQTLPNYGIIDEMNNMTGEPDRQDERWSRIIKQWESATKNRDSIFIGDLNLDKINWVSPDQRISNSGDNRVPATDWRSHQKLKKPKRYFN